VKTGRWGHWPTTAIAQQVPHSIWYAGAHKCALRQLNHESKCWISQGTCVGLSRCMGSRVAWYPKAPEISSFQSISSTFVRSPACRASPMESMYAFHEMLHPWALHKPLPLPFHYSAPACPACWGPWPMPSWIWLVSPCCCFLFLFFLCFSFLFEVQVAWTEADEPLSIP
jgi:hypothetical protein